MKHRAVLKIASGAEAIGFGETDGEAVRNALADSITVREANPHNVSLAVWHDYVNGVMLSYCSSLSGYLEEVS